MMKNFENDISIELNDRELAFINEIRQNPSKGNERVRTGRVSVAELMGMTEVNSCRKEMMLANGKPMSIPRTELMRLLPPLAPMYPIGPCKIQQPFAHLPSNVYTQDQQRKNRSIRSSQVPFKRFSQATTPTNQFRNNIQVPYKVKPPLFASYLNFDAVSRGIETGYLHKGTLRIDSRNYEEAVVDIGDEIQEVLILGMQDRNRALHGDLVAVRIKSRENWVVCENVYNAWRNNTLKDHLDEDGKPLAIPPLERNESHIIKLPEKCKICKTVEPTDGKFDREELLLIAIKMGLNRSASSRDGICSENLIQKLNSFNILRKTNQSLLEILPIDKSIISNEILLNSKAGKILNLDDFLSNGHRSKYRALSSMPNDNWGMPDICLQKVAEVVCILEQQNCRAAVGTLKSMADDNQNFVLFSPNDSKLPRMMIPAEQAPLGFFEHPSFFSKFIYVARLVDWHPTDRHGRGKLYKSLGLAGDIDAETEGLLLASNIDTREFSPLSLSSLPIMENLQWHIDQREFKYRRDFREEQIFTLKTSTTRYLCNAFHCKSIENYQGTENIFWEIGIHVVDVSHFVHEGTELDHWAALRSAAVHLIHKTIPMLPISLTEDICSLKTGVDRLAISIVWIMDENGTIADEWMGRSIIRSYCCLDEPSVKKILECERDLEKPETTTFDNVSTEMVSIILNLNRISNQLRDQRNYSCLVPIHEKSCNLLYDLVTGCPNEAILFEINPVDQLVEEFQILANSRVAQKLMKIFPKIALLRRHFPPKQKALRDLLMKIDSLGIEVEDISVSSLTSILRNQLSLQSANIFSQVLLCMLKQIMPSAVYFCAGSCEKQNKFFHYARGVEPYTHFTSPVDRYADIMVHRLLSSALGYSPPPTLTPKNMENLALYCNERKINGDNVSIASSEMFFCLFLKKCGQITEKAIVIEISEQCIIVFIWKYGITRPIYTSSSWVHRKICCKSETSSVLVVDWKTQNGTSLQQNIHLFSVVNVVLSAIPQSIKYSTILKAPSPGEENLMLSELCASMNCE